MNNIFYEMIFKRKSFHIFRNVGNESIDEYELNDIQNAYSEFTPLNPEIKTAIRIVAEKETNCKLSGGELTAEVFADYLRHKCLSDCTFLSKNARCQQTAGTLSEEDAAPLQRDNNKSQATRFLAA